MSNPLLSLRNLSRRYEPGGPAAVDNLSLDLQQGEILALIGPSGCGKTTSLRMIAGFEQPDAGQVLLEGIDATPIRPEKRGIGMVFQDYALFPHMTVAQNVLFGAPRKDARNLARYLSLVGLEGFDDRFPDQLSGGQQQRVALARSFAAQPRLILLDEPFSNLDAALRSIARREIRKLLKSTGISVIFVTHDQEEALSFADRVAVMHDGRLLQIGPAAQVYDRPTDAFVAGFLGRTNLLEGMADGAQCSTPLGQVPLARQARGPVQVSLRPENLSISRAGTEAGASGHITAVEFKGHDMTYWVDCHGTDIQVDAMHGPRLPEGTPVMLQITGPGMPLNGSVAQ